MIFLTGSLLSSSIKLLGVKNFSLVYYWIEMWRCSQLYCMRMLVFFIIFFTHSQFQI